MGYFKRVLALAVLAPLVFAISSCQTLNTANTVNTLTANVSASGASCFTVTASNVTLDCNGSVVFGDRTAGMAGLVTNQTNTTVKNCTITNFDYDVWFQTGSNNSVVQQSTVKNASTGGVFLDGTGVSNATAVTVNNDSYGFYFNASLDDVVSNSTVTASVSQDVYSNNQARNTFINTTFNRSFVGWGDLASNFTVKWFFTVLAQNATVGAISGASVNMTNASASSPQVQTTTSSSGKTAVQTLAEYLQAGYQVYGTNTTNYTPYNVTGNVADYYFVGSSVQNSTNVSVTSSQTFTLVLSGNWALIQGNFNGNITLSNSNNLSFNDWLNASPYGNVYAVPHGATLNLTAMTAMTRARNGSVDSDDFDDVDSLLGLSGQVDSNKQVFGGGTSTPSTTATFTPQGYSVANVPVVNSTNTSNFLTGILWDSSVNTTYSVAAKPVLVYSTQANRSTQGKYGVHDYEIRVPVNLQTYSTGSSIDLYVELK